MANDELDVVGRWQNGYEFFTTSQRGLRSGDLTLNALVMGFFVISTHHYPFDLSLLLKTGN